MNLLRWELDRIRRYVPGRLWPEVDAVGEAIRAKIPSIEVDFLQVMFDRRRGGKPAWPARPAGEIAGWFMVIGSKEDDAAALDEAAGRFGRPVVEAALAGAIGLQSGASEAQVRWLSASEAAIPALVAGLVARRRGVRAAAEALVDAVRAAGLAAELESALHHALESTSPAQRQPLLAQLSRLRPAPPAVAEASAIAAALAAFGRRDVHAAINALVALWRATRDPSLADWIDELTAAIPVFTVTGKTVTARQSSWINAARTSDDVELSLLVLAPWPSEWRAATARLEACVGREHPVLARRVIELLEAGNYRTFAGHAFSLAAADCLTTCADPRTGGRLAALGLAGDPSARVRDVPLLSGNALAAALPARPPVYVDLAPLLAAAGAPARSSVPELLARVYANPEDPDARRVLADALTEAEDPRGEFIHLQFAGEGEGAAAERARKRAATLLNTHRRDWVPDQSNPGSVEFKGGFAWRAGLRDYGRAAFLAHPSWSTVRELLWTGGEDGSEVPLVFGVPSMRSLTAWHRLRHAFALRDCVAPHVAELSFVAPVVQDGAPIAPQHADFPALDGFTGLRRLAVTCAPFNVREPDYVARSPVWRRLEEVALGIEPNRIASLLAWLPAGPRIVRFVPLLHRFPGEPDWEIAIERAGAMNLRMRVRPPGPKTSLTPWDVREFERAVAALDIPVVR